MFCTMQANYDNCVFQCLFRTGAGVCFFSPTSGHTISAVILKSTSTFYIYILSIFQGAQTPNMLLWINASSMGQTKPKLPEMHVHLRIIVDIGLFLVTYNKEHVLQTTSIYSYNSKALNPLFTNISYNPFSD